MRGRIHNSTGFSKYSYGLWTMYSESVY